MALHLDDVDVLLPLKHPKRPLIWGFHGLLDAIQTEPDELRGLQFLRAIVGHASSAGGAVWMVNLLELLHNVFDADSARQDLWHNGLLARETTVRTAPVFVRSHSQPE